MGAEPQQLHVALFPFMAQGHMIPTLDIAKLFASRGVRATILTTPLNAPAFSKPLERRRVKLTSSFQFSSDDISSGDPSIDIEVLPFPIHEAKLPQGCENLEQASMGGPGTIPRFFQAVGLLQGPLQDYLERARPDCLVADMFFFPWVAEPATKFNIPLLMFHGRSFFSYCCEEVVRLYNPCRNILSDEDEFSLPFLPHDVKMTRLQLPEEARGQNEVVSKPDVKCYGTIVNSFYELEPEYADLFRKRLGWKAWHIGPVSLCNRSVEDKGQRGKQSSIDEHQCLKWLDSKRANSVIYVCFGSTAHLTAPQLKEIATGLEASGFDFIWVVRDDGKVISTSDKGEDFLPEGFELRTQGRGLLIRGWAPQVLILEHEAIGGFVTHCGWNSMLEGISGGVPLVTWPVFAEQFYNEKMVTQILKTGVPIGAKKWSRVACTEEVIKRDDIQKALTEIMVGNEAQERRNRARKLKDMAWKAVEQGGSSYNDLSALISELRVRHG